MLARIVVQELPDIATIIRSPANRGDKVYIDYLQNRHGQTIVAPFSARPLPGAPVSTPLKWTELNKRNTNAKYTLKTTASRLRRLKTDPMIAVTRERTNLEAALDRLQQHLGSSDL